MNIKLIDVDNKYRERKRRGPEFPNLTIMKAATSFINEGHTVWLDRTKPDVWDFKNWAQYPEPDLVFLSCVFEKNRLHADKEIAKHRCDVISGGSGISITQTTPIEITNSKPDYDLYPSSYSMGFTTRGCIRNCGYCIVPNKEGKFRREHHIKMFHDFRFNSCKLLDNNILADKEWFFENTNWAIENKVKLDITQGLDVRLLTDEIADHLKWIKFVDQQIKFAWDIQPFGATEDQIISGIDKLRERGFNLKRNISFYVIVGVGWNGHECFGAPCSASDLYRTMKLRDLGVMVRIQKFHDSDETLNHLARWGNKQELYKSCTFSEYLESKKAGAP